jgi:hypothetical protein
VPSAPVTAKSKHIAVKHHPTHDEQSLTSIMYHHKTMSLIHLLKHFLFQSLRGLQDYWALGKEMYEERLYEEGVHEEGVRDYDFLFDPPELVITFKRLITADHV